LEATVINVLPNGNLVVAGERTIAMNGGMSGLRFSGIVNPRDIQAGNIVASSDAANPRLEIVGRGDVSDAASRSWIQRVLADSLSFW
jgi:flagellar L-ring protein precursor FlgH